MSELRVRKVQEFIKQEVSNMLLNELKDPRIGFVTVTGVEVTGDLREAKIFVSLFGDEKMKKASLEGLNKAKGFIRKELGQRLKIYYTPELFFEEDKSLDYGMHIDGLLKKIHKEDEE
ncbi:30S ribosome-binding factor RbfA [uncultured Dialister sp.]|uniref:30S ribosome-binding factor RbfA n=1 Tax=uncultured Dialister sp. TaxID=278064 RepID=UPI0025CC0005|nr:30S ribosome-binding factor RbfA [uncultured Dialister sp.]